MLIHNLDFISKTGGTKTKLIRKKRKKNPFKIRGQIAF